MAKNEIKLKISAEEVLNRSKRVEDRANVTFRIKKSVLKDFKRICKDRETTASSVIEVLLEDFIQDSSESK